MAEREDMLALAECRAHSLAVLVARQTVLVAKLERGGQDQAARIARRVLRVLENSLARAQR